MDQLTYLILHDIRSVENVGSIFRTADARGVTKIYCTGYTPMPTDRFGRKRNDFAKTALGAEKHVPWAHADIDTCITNIKQKGIHVVAVEQNEKSLNYLEIEYSEPVAFVFGNEIYGLPDNVLQMCDKIIEIPLRGSKESLNVSVAAGIILFSFGD